MVRLETGGQELRAQHLEVFFDLEDFGFPVEVVNRGHLHAPGGNAEGGVLQDLEFVDGGGADIWVPDWTSVGYWEPIRDL